MIRHNDGDIPELQKVFRRLQLGSEYPQPVGMYITGNSSAFDGFPKNTYTFDIR